MFKQDYWREVNETHAHYKGAWRFGQTAFNVLHNHEPELANGLRGTLNDPFHLTDEQVMDNHPTWQYFVNYVNQFLPE